MAANRTGITALRGALVLAAVATLTAAAPAPKTVAPGAVRTLDAINIEGEIAVPQVLFITARDTRRYRDGLGLKFQLSAVAAGRAAVLPSRLRVGAQMQSHKEE